MVFESGSDWMSGPMTAGHIFNHMSIAEIVIYRPQNSPFGYLLHVNSILCSQSLVRVFPQCSGWNTESKFQDGKIGVIP